MNETQSVADYLADGGLTHAGWSRALRDGVLLGQHCPDCGHATAAPKAACAKCGSREIGVVQLPTDGEVYTETTVAVAPAGFEAPYQVALVSLGEATVLAHVDGEASIGDAVELCDTVEADGGPVPVFG